MRRGRRVAFLHQALLPQEEGAEMTAKIEHNTWTVTVEPGTTPEDYVVRATTSLTAQEAAALVLEQGGAIKMADSLFVQAHPNETAAELTSVILAQTLAAKLPKVRRRIEQIAEHEVTAWSDD